MPIERVALQVIGTIYRGQGGEAFLEKSTKLLLLLPRGLHNPIFGQDVEEVHPVRFVRQTLASDEPPGWTDVLELLPTERLAV
jgi:hypothetical protein